MELGLPKGGNYTEVTGNIKISLYTAESCNIKYCFSKLFILYSKTSKTKHWIIRRKLLHVYIHIIIYIYTHT